MTPIRHDLTIRHGGTFSDEIRLTQADYAYRAITGASQGAPCILTAPSHALPPDWPFQLRSVRGMVELNNVETKSNNEGVATDWGLGANGKEFYRAKVASVSTIELNDVVSLDYAPYQNGGVIVYQPPVDLSVYAGARMQIREDVDSEVILLSLASPTQIVLDNVNKKIVLQLSAIEAAAITWELAWYDLELFTAGGIVDSPTYGKVKVTKEVTR